MMSVKKGRTAVNRETPAAVISDKKIIRRILLFFFLLCFLLYGRSIKNKYSMDDEFVTLNNEQISRGIKAIPEIFRTTYVVDEKRSSYEYRPLVKVTYAIEYQFFGQNPHISHVINILLYFFDAWLLFSILRTWILKNHHLIFSFLVTTLFIVHPLHSEVVLSLKNRDVMMSFLFAFLSLRFYLKFADAGKVQHLLLGIFCMFLGLISKKDSLTFLVIIPLTVYFFTNVPGKRLVLISVLNLSAFFMTLALGKSVVNESNRELALFENPFFFGSTLMERIPLGIDVIWYYLKMFVVPYPLLAYYGTNQVPIPGWTDPFVILTMLILAAAGYFVFRLRRTKNIELYAILYFFITISMFLNIVKPVVGIVAERFAYIPSVGLCILVVWALFRLFKLNTLERGAKFSYFGGKMLIPFSLICLIFSIQVIARNPAWKDHYTLYETDVKKGPESAHLHTLYAAANIQKIKQNASMPKEEKRKYIGKALHHYKESIRIIPDYISSHNNVGMIYYSFYSQPAEAIPYLEKAIKLDTGYVEAHFNLATCKAALGDYETAERYYLKTIELDPEFTNAYYSLSAVYAKKNELDKILNINQKAIDKGIVSDIPYVSIGNVHFMRGDTLKGMPYLEKAIELKSNNRALNSFLANYYKDKGDLKKANHYFDLMGKSTK